MIEQSIYDAVEAIAGAGATFWSAVPEDDAAMPYAVLDPPASSLDEYDSAHVGTETLRLRVHVFALSLLEARQLLKSIEARLVFGDLGVAAADGQHLQTIKVADTVELDPDRDADGNEVWHGILDLDLLVARTPGQ